MPKRPRHAPMLYPNTYVWLVFFSAMDIMLTWIILSVGGREVNALANLVLNRFGLSGMVIFKFALVIVVISICEAVGRRNFRLGGSLARWSVAITCIPVTVALVQLLLFL